MGENPPDAAAFDAAVASANTVFRHVHVLVRAPAPGATVSGPALCGEEGTFEMLGVLGTEVGRPGVPPQLCPDCERKLAELHRKSARSR